MAAIQILQEQSTDRGLGKKMREFTSIRLNRFKLGREMETLSCSELVELWKP